jgi:replicative DNA helicase
MRDIKAPASEQAERSILGSILLDNGMFYQAQSLLPQNFSLSAHSSIWSAMCDLHASSQPIDMVTLPEQLSKAGKLESSNGVEYISSLLDGIPDRPSVEVYVKIVRDRAHRRYLIEQCQLTIERLLDQGTSTADCINVMEEAALDVRADAGVKSSHSMVEIVPDVIQELEKIRQMHGLIGFTTGIPCIDQATTGVRRDEYWVIGARPSRGKTVLGTQIAVANAMQGTPVLVFSFEMTRRQFVRRMIPNYALIEAYKIRDPRYMNASEMEAAKSCSKELQKLPIWVVDPDGMKSSEVTSAAKYHIHRYGVRLIVVDYLQIVRGPQRELRERVAHCSNALRAIPKTEGVPVIALSQLRRLEDENTRPSLDSLKESGDIEAHAHTVILLYRPRDKEGHWTNEDEAIIAKQREGLVGTEKVILNESRLAFFDRSTS